MPTIVLTGGGSGGHITPLLSLAHELKEESPKCHIVYIGLKGEKLEGLQEQYQAFDEVRLIPSGKFRRYHGESALAHLTDIKTLALNSRDLTRVSRGILAARRQLKQIKPDVVFSKGSFVAVPVGIAAHQLGIPIITHDSDAVPGLANRIVGRWAKIHAVGQPADNYNYPKDTTRYVGIPVDRRIKPVTVSVQKQNKEALGLPPDSTVLLVSGGGLGSGQLNQMITAISHSLLADNPKLHIILITGDQHQAEVREHYQHVPGAAGRVDIIGFTDEFYKYSAAADLIVTRAGATSLAEFALQGKACVVIPAAQLTGGHQLANARQLKAKGAAAVLNSEVEPQKLLKELNALLANQQGRAELGDKLAAFGRPKAAKDLAELILTAAGSGAGV